MFVNPFFLITLVFADVIIVTIFKRNRIFACMGNSYVVGAFRDILKIFNNL